MGATSHLYGFIEVDRALFTNPIKECAPPIIGQGIILTYQGERNIFAKNEYFQGPVPLGYVLPHSLQGCNTLIRGEFKAMGIIFKPGQFRHLFPFPLTEHLGDMVPLEEINYRPLIDIHGRVADAKSNDERAQLIDKFLLKQLRDARYEVDGVDVVLAKMLTSPEKKIQEFYRSVHTVERNFRRQFKRAMGVTPKQYQRLVRFSMAMQRIRTGQFRLLGDLAFECGYYDQKEFGKEFKLFAGQTPSSYVKKLFPLSEAIHWRDAAGTRAFEEE